MNRNTATRDKHRAIIKRDRPPCGICGREINYDAAHLDPGEFVVDHIIPLSITGPAGDTLDNKQAAHRACNRTKSNKVEGQSVQVGRRFVTDRDWWSVN